MLPPLPQQVLHELAEVQWVVENKPKQWDGFQQKAGQEDQYWFANVAYWRAYPLAPKQLPKNPTADEKVWIDTWLRIHDLVVKRLEAQNPPAPWDGKGPRWPLLTPPQKWKSGSKFGAKRPWDKPQTRIHAGIDLSAGYGASVLAPEAGVIAGVNLGWDGPHCKAVLLHLDSGLSVLMGCMQKDSSPPVGTRVCPGQTPDCATHTVARIGKYSGGSSMLHFQLYKRHLTVAEVNKQKAWYVGQPQPPDLIDPADFLTAAMTNTPLNPQNAANAFYGFTPEEPAGEIEGDGEESEGTEEDNADASGPPAVVPPASGGFPVLPLVLGGTVIAGVVWWATR